MDIEHVYRGLTNNPEHTGSQVRRIANVYSLISVLTFWTDGDSEQRLDNEIGLYPELV